MDEYVVAKYIRLSNDDTHTNSMSIENQRLLLDKYIADMDIPNITSIELVDNGYSGTNFERPAVQELLELVRNGKVNCIIVKDFSRFGRNAIETGYFIERVFPLYRTRFISITDCYDSNEHEGSTGGIEVALKFLVHEHYSRDLSKKIKAAKRERTLRGEHITKNCAFGFKKVGNCLDIDPDAAETVRLIYKLAYEGKGAAAIARELYRQKRPTPKEHKNHKRKSPAGDGFQYIWKECVIRKILRDEQYIGTYVGGKSVLLEVGGRVPKKVPESEWVRIPNHHPVIISNEVFERVQGMINTRSRHKSQTVRQYACSQNSPLKGKVVCGCCGHTMSLSNTKNSAFHCLFTRSAPDKQCYRLKVNNAELENALFEIVSKQAQVVLNIDGLSEATPATPDTVRQSECERLIEKAGKAKRDLYERFVGGGISVPEYLMRKTEIDAEFERLNRVYTALTNEKSQKQLETETRDLLSEVVTDSGVLSQKIVDVLIDKVRVFPDNRIEIEWKIAGLCNDKVELPI